ncbi:hypothetical protein [Kitasatospora sp. McL0602]|uniref:hypothetical protein n=1 Tax=Kitasatospora sp. McL0602 TaxID=3439530 RepID=UPI003F8898DB
MRNCCGRPERSSPRGVSSALGAGAPAAVGVDPAGGYGSALLLPRQSTADVSAVRPFTAATGDLRVDARLRAGQTTAPLGLHLLDASGTAVAQFSLAADGYAAYSDNGSWTDSAFAYPAGVWLRVSLVLHPSTGTYDVSVDDVPQGSGRLTAGAGAATQLRLLARSGATPADFAADDVLVQSLS